MDRSKIDLKNMPVQPDIISKILNMDVDSDKCFHELDSLIRSDQGVASLVLRVVNSPFYSRGHKVTTIPLAISLLGFSVIRSLTMLAFGRSLFAQTKDQLFRLHIWQHSLLTAIAGQFICQKLGDSKGKEEAFIAGLMHDTGKVLLFTHNPKQYLEALSYALEHRCSSHEAERKFFGLDHYQVGQQAVKEWKLPERFNDYMGTDLSIAKTDTPQDSVRLSLVSANCLIKAMGIGANPLADYTQRKVELMALGLGEELSEDLLQDFLDGLMENETYQLCANI